jgi:peptidyl-prolyl cis-trans isomerase C
LRGRFPTEKEYKEALDQMGVNQEELEKRVRRDLTIQDFIKNEFTSKTEVTEKDIKTFYDSKKDQFTKPEEVKASHILLKVEAEAGEDKKKEARAKLEDVQKKIKKGEDFAALAKELSDCPSSSKGGDLGSFRKGQMVKPFEDAAFGMEAGQMSDIVETRFGYHLIKVTEKKAGGTVSFEEVKPQIEKYLTQEKVQEALDKHVGVLREASTVETFLQE